MDLPVEFTEMLGDFLRRRSGAKRAAKVNCLCQRLIRLPEELRHRAVRMAFLQVIFKVLLDVIEFPRDRVSPLADHRNPVRSLLVLMFVLMPMDFALDRLTAPRSIRASFFMFVFMFVLVNRLASCGTILSNRPGTASETHCEHRSGYQ